MRTRTLSFVTILLLYINHTFAQVNLAGQDSSRRVITTAVPFLMISPDARAGAMGEAGVATSPRCKYYLLECCQTSVYKKRLRFQPFI
ncbi:MAG: hypothetical protein U5K79_06185 [Cyclobacteriaceae bacterium]|nr:hypothetical protein [Cyclobacteriaceae bacterium]